MSTEHYNTQSAFTAMEAEPLNGADPKGSDRTLMDYSEFSDTPARGAFAFRGSQELKGRLVFLLDCDQCTDGVKEIPIVSGMMVSKLGDVILGHRELHADLDATQTQETTYAQDLIAATLHNSRPLVE